MAGSTCLCRPLYQVPASSAEAASLSVAAAGQSSSVSSSQAPGRVQKSSKRQSSAVVPEHIVKGLEARLQQSQVHNRSDSGQSSNDSPAVNGQNPPSAESSINIKTQSSTVESKSGSCCSKRSQLSIPATEQSASSSSMPVPPDEKLIKTEPYDFQSTWTQQSFNEVPTWNHHQGANGYNQTQGYVNPDMSNFVFSTTTDPSSAIMTPDYTSPQLDSGAFSNVPTNQYSSSDFVSYFNQGSVPVGDPSHECSCGDDCQCLGCASHPFNATTRQHVQEMGYMMSQIAEEEGSENSTPFRQPQSPTQHDYGSNGQQQTTSIYSGQTSPTLGFDPATMSPSAFTPPQYMQPSEYYTLEYPIGMPNVCSNVDGTCLCGEDCSCVGCLTHSGHDGVTLEPTSSSNETGSANQAAASLSSHDWNDTVPVPRSLNEFSPSGLSPPVLETPLV